MGGWRKLCPQNVTQLSLHLIPHHGMFGNFLINHNSRLATGGGCDKKCDLATAGNHTFTHYCNNRSASTQPFGTREHTLVLTGFIGKSHCQLLASYETTASNHLATICSFHTVQKTVGFNALALLEFSVDVHNGSILAHPGKDYNPNSFTGPKITLAIEYCGKLPYSNLYMPTQDFSAIWHAVLEDLQDIFPESTVKALFTKSGISALSNDEISIYVDNSTTQQFTRKYAEGQILATVEKQTAISPARVTYEIRKQGSAPAPRRRSETSFTPQLFQEKSTRGADLINNPHLSSNLNPKFTFDAFISGNRNRLAYAAAQGVVTQPGSLYNPLYLYGGVGLGKTHLMQAIGNEIIKRQPDTKVVYVSCEQFLTEFVSAIKQGKPEIFKAKYRTVDVFLIDDIQFIAGRDGVQEEFFHTFNTLYQANKQIVMTSDKRPSEIKGLEERLTSRMSMGMVTDIQLPDQSTRLAILQTKAQEKGIRLPEHVLRYIAETIETNIRELEGALTLITADLTAREAPATLDEVRISLRSLLADRMPRKQSNAAALTRVVAEHYEIAEQDLLGQSRQRHIVHPRHVLMYLMKHEAGMTYPMIGKELGGKDHTTIMHGVEKITTDLKRNADLLDELQAIKETFYERRER
jgi:chromosomal replication initiator protein